MAGGGAFPVSFEEVMTGEKVCLRTLRPDDLELLYRWENDPEAGRYGDCGAGIKACEPGFETERFSRDEIRQFIENQQYDIYITGQVRFVICCCEAKDARWASGTSATCGSVDTFDAGKISGRPVGLIDLFDFDAGNRSAGVGILICDPNDRRRGYGAEALEIVEAYASRVLGLCELWCNVAVDNRASLALFRGAKFVFDDHLPAESTGTKKTLDFRQEPGTSSLPQSARHTICFGCKDIAPKEKKS